MSNITRPIYNEYEVRGNFIYINDTCIKFETEEQANNFLLQLVKEQVLR